MMIKPTIEELRYTFCEWIEEHDDGDEHFDIIRLENNLIDMWRHGTVHEAIFHRESDNTYWCVVYRTDKDGNYNDFRDKELSYRDVFQVEKKEKITYEWVAI